MAHWKARNLRSHANQDHQNTIQEVGRPSGSGLDTWAGCWNAAITSALLVKPQAGWSRVKKVLVSDPQPDLCDFNIQKLILPVVLVLKRVYIHWWFFGGLRKPTERCLFVTH